MSIFASDALQGEHAIITGATGGIGQVIAHRVAGMGASVTITGRDADKLDVLKQGIVQSLPEARIHAVAADLALDADRRRLVAEAERHLGPVSLLVNNAGTYRFGTVEELTESELDELMQVNFKTAVLLTQLVYIGMKERRKGRIVNVSSLSGLRGRFGHTAYSASKFALMGFTQCFALEAIQHQVRVNAVCPGNVDTEMGRGVIGRLAAVRGLTFDEQAAKTRSDIPSGRVTTPEEVADTIAFLLTDAGGNIVGESVKISGGTLM
jgi:3-oxoacyl-[acyl-carrier protein] reductase